MSQVVKLQLIVLNVKTNNNFF